MKDIKAVYGKKALLALGSKKPPDVQKGIISKILQI